MSRPVDYAGPYLLVVKDLVLFTIMIPGLPDWDDAECPYERLTDLECAVTGALPSEL